MTKDNITIIPETTFFLTSTEPTQPQNIMLAINKIQNILHINYKHSSHAQYFSRHRIIAYFHVLFFFHKLHIYKDLKVRNCTLNI